VVARPVVTALQDINLDITLGEFVAVVGPSGCGKSTLLRILAGLIPTNSGTVWFGNRKPEGPRLQSMNFMMDVAGSFSILIVLAVVGLVLNHTLIMIRHRVLFWERLGRVEPGAAADTTLAEAPQADSTLPAPQK